MNDSPILLSVRPLLSQSVPRWIKFRMKAVFSGEIRAPQSGVLDLIPFSIMKLPSSSPLPYIYAS